MLDYCRKGGGFSIMLGKLAVIAVKNFYIESFAMASLK